MRMDHYQTLGVSKTAGQDEIKAAYRKLAAKHHPDRGGDTAEFQKIQAAYDVLGDEAKRQEYDNPHFNNTGFHGFHQSFNFGDIFGQHSPFADIFRQAHNRKPSYRTRVQVTLEQMALGSEVSIQINTSQNPNNGIYKINIPQGINHGQAVRYDGLIPGAELIVEFYQLPHARLRRENLDIYSHHKISALEILTGKTLEIETVWNNKVQVTVPPCTSATSKLRIHNKGLIHNGQQGHHYVLLDIEIPAKISSELQAAILKELNN